MRRAGNELKSSRKPESVIPDAYYVRMAETQTENFCKLANVNGALLLP